jgi:tRNA threonylcarbamoyladenosine biosynthesis protein TsaE
MAVAAAVGVGFEDSDDFLAAGLDEYFDRGGVCVIEWSSVIDDLLPKDTVRIRITGTGDSRNIEVSDEDTVL